jgi:hypothetical protein
VTRYNRGSRFVLVGNEDDGRISFRIDRIDKDGKLIKGISKFYYRNAIGDHGFYCGPTQFLNIFAVKNYVIESIDAVDEGGRRHDQGYDKVGANADNAMDSGAPLKKYSTNL